MFSSFQPGPIEKKLGVHFRDKTLLQQSFIHRSFSNENQDLTIPYNERLEFLGDSVLGLILSSYLFQKNPELDEGALSALRSQLVDAPACARYIEVLDVAPFLLLGKGERLNRSKGRDSIMADLFEAIIGALYIDQGLESVNHFFFGHFQGIVDQLTKKPLRNWKAELQDYAQKNFQKVPVYEIIEESGPQHERFFKIAVWVNDEKLGEGSGSSKKEAQIESAKEALIYLSKKESGHI